MKSQTKKNTKSSTASGSAKPRAKSTSQASKKTSAKSPSKAKVAPTKAGTAKTPTARTAKAKAGTAKTAAAKTAASRAKKSASPAKKAPQSTKSAKTTKAPKKTTSRKAPSAAKAAKPKAKKPARVQKIPKDLTYKVDQQIVYPLQGVGKVTAIEERPFRDQTLLYYIIYLEVSDMTIMVPVDKADELGIRAIVSKKESNVALELLAEEHEPITADWKMRYQMNLDLLKKGSVTDIATVVRTLYSRSKVKELPILERKLYDSALRLLVDEVSFSLDKDKESVEKLIFDQMDKV